VTDRRTSLRFEIVGRLRGSLATSQPVRLHDVSPGGALVEMAFPPAVDSQHAVYVRWDHHVSTIEARVRHVRPSFEMGRFLVGLEFTPPDHVLHEVLEGGFDRETA
jgi:PilZ domain